MIRFIDRLLTHLTDRPTTDEYLQILNLAVTQSQRSALLQERVDHLEDKLRKVNEALYPDVEA